jgi:hypothetical protein
LGLLPQDRVDDDEAGDGDGEDEVGEPVLQATGVEFGAEAAGDQ